MVAYRFGLVQHWKCKKSVGIFSSSAHPGLAEQYQLRHRDTVFTVGHLLRTMLCHWTQRSSHKKGRIMQNPAALQHNEACILRGYAL